MTDKFHAKIKTALADDNLQAALDANAERRIQARKQAYASLPEDLEALRQRAHAMRLATIDNLEGYLEQFVQHTQQNGLIVHRAGNAASALQIVLNIARQKNARRVAKSKSMVSEEIRLNPALEASDIQVVETDLGEFIVQLRGEPPAHIITPAVHLRRNDVAKLFAEKLNVPYTEDISALTSVAHRILREVFLEADIGISGVNFGVVESGTLCILTNEGNGRMVTTLPTTHIALMGIERLVPTFEDLSLMLELLPRSATGQKLTVYTNLIQSPRRSGEIDGPNERHLVLIDNGRRRLLNSPLHEILLCIRCGACLNVCPVFREIGGHAYISRQGEISAYAGPIGSVISPGLFGVPEFGHLARASSLCGACKEACPVAIDLPKLLLRVRAGGLQIEMQRTPPNVPSSLSLGLKIFSQVARRASLYGYAQTLAGFVSRLASPRQPWLRLPAFTGWGYSKDLPSPAPKPFSRLWAEGKIKNTQPEIPPPISTTPGNPQPPVSLPSQTAAWQRFARELEDLGVECIPCHPHQLAPYLLQVLQNKGIQTIQTWLPEFLPTGLLEHLQRAGIQTVQQPDPEIKVGLTGALAGVAASGTLVLPGGPGRPLTASLLPDLHLVVIEAKNIYDRLDQVLGISEVKNSSSTVLVTGPSRTADIEMTLTIGVHGPKELQVFCLLD
jgi:L-lactate dehydrogenase complex protein LldF